MGWPKDPGGDGAKLLQSLNGLGGRSRPERLKMGESAATTFWRSVNSRKAFLLARIEATISRLIVNFQRPCAIDTSATNLTGPLS